MRSGKNGDQAMTPYELSDHNRRDQVEHHLRCDGQRSLFAAAASSRADQFSRSKSITIRQKAEERRETTVKSSRVALDVDSLLCPACPTWTMTCSLCSAKSRPSPPKPNAALHPVMVQLRRSESASKKLGELSSALLLYNSIHGLVHSSGSDMDMSSGSDEEEEVEKEVEEPPSPPPKSRGKAKRAISAPVAYSDDDAEGEDEEDDSPDKLYPLEGLYKDKQDRRECVPPSLLAGDEMEVRTGCSP